MQFFFTLQPDAWLDVKADQSLANGHYSLQVTDGDGGPGHALYRKQSGAAPAAADDGALVVTAVIYDLDIDSTEAVYLRSRERANLRCVMETDD